MPRRPPPPRTPIPQDKREDVIRLYKDDVIVVDIVAQTGVPRASVYNILRAAGITPGRAAPVGGQAAAREAQLVQERLMTELDGWKAQTRRAEKRIKELEAEVARLRDDLTREQANFDHVLRNGTKPKAAAMPKRRAS